MNLAESLFGPEYSDAISESVGMFTCRAGTGPVDIIHTAGPNIKMSLLPPGGYAIGYLGGSFLLIGVSPTTFVVGGDNGMQVRWRSDKAFDWTETGFALEGRLPEMPQFRHATSIDVDSLFYLEFTRPHRMQLVPPNQAAGNVKVRVTRYVPKFISGQAVDNLIKQDF